MTGSTTGIRQPQFLFLGHINIEFTQLGQCWRVPQTSGFIQEGQTIGSRVLNTGTITNHCPHIIEPLRHIQIYHLLIEIQCLLRIFFYSSGPPCTIKIRQIMHGLPMTALHCLAVNLDDTAPGPQSIGLGQGCCFAVPSIGLRIQRRQMVFSLAQTNGLLLAITGTPARQSTAQSPIAISRITAPVSSRADLRRSPGSGEEAEDGPLSSWENANQDQRQVDRKYHHIVCAASHRGVPHSVNIGTSLIKTPDMKKAASSFPWLAARR